MSDTLIEEETATPDVPETERWVIVLHHIIGYKRHEVVGPFNSEAEATQWRDTWITHPDTEIVPLQDPLDVERYIIERGQQ